MENTNMAGTIQSHIPSTDEPTVPDPPTTDEPTVPDPPSIEPPASVVQESPTVPLIKLVTYDGEVSCSLALLRESCGTFRDMNPDKFQLSETHVWIYNVQEYPIRVVQLFIGSATRHDYVAHTDILLLLLMASAYQAPRAWLLGLNLLRSRRLTTPDIHINALMRRIYDCNYAFRSKAFREWINLGFRLSHPSLQAGPGFTTPYIPLPHFNAKVLELNNPSPLQACLKPTVAVKRRRPYTNGPQPTKCRRLEGQSHVVTKKV